VISQASKNIVNIVKCQCEAAQSEEHLNRAIEALKAHLSRAAPGFWETYLSLLESVHELFEKANGKGFAFDRDIEGPIAEFFNAIRKRGTQTD
jgi:hypothetical protein